VGAWSLVANTTGNHNTTIGMKTLFANTTGDYNSAIGVQALELNTTGDWNTALGSGALNQNTTGSLNTAGGVSAMWCNRTGNFNVAFGQEALAGSYDGNNNTAMGFHAMFSTENVSGTGGVAFGHSSDNTAVGYEALRDVSTGSWNVALGVHALRINSSGGGNIGVGCYSLANNTAGGSNIAIGNWAISNNTAGHENVAVGDRALDSNKTGNRNTAIGYGADVSQNQLVNATAIGYGAIATESNQVRIGNYGVTSIGGVVPWSCLSDARVKKNIQYNVPGLAFINQLQPITYNYDITETANFFRSGKVSAAATDSLTGLSKAASVAGGGISRALDGFVAPEVEKTAQAIGYNFSGIDIDGNGVYSLQYATFVVPLVKAVQELSEQSESKDSAIVSLQQQINALTEAVNRLSGNNTVLKSISVPNATLEQNFPNPFSQTTVIRYTLPESFQSAQIAVTNMSGNKVRQISLSGSASNNVTIEAGSLPAGMYAYSLYVDNTLIDTKKMILTK
jgi:hypothetical protein